jgi:MFS family permease
MDSSDSKFALNEIWLLHLINLVSFTATTMAKPFIPLYASSLGAPPMIIGVIFTSYAFLPFFLAIPTGSLTDLWGAKRLIILGTWGTALSLLFAAFKASIPALIISQAIFGVAQLFTIVSIQTFVASLGEGKARESNLGYLSTFTSAGQLIGPLIGGPLVDAYGFRFTLAAGACLAVVPPLIATLLPVKKNRVTPTRGLMGDLHEVPRLLRNDGIKAAILASFSVLFVEGLREVFYPIYLADLNFSVTVIGILLSTRSLLAILIRLLMPTICHLFGRYHTLLGALLLMAIGVISTPLLYSFWPLALSSALIGIGTGLTHPLSMVAVADNTDPQELGFALGIRMTGNRLAQLTNPLFFGIATQIVGLPAAFFLAGILLTITSAFLLRWRQAFQDYPLKSISN